MHKRHYLAVAILFTGLITFLSLKESSDLPEISIPHLDKIFHVVAYFFLINLWAAYLKLQTKKYGILLILTIISLFLLVYGIIIEVLQSRLTITRMFEINDLIANLTGMLIGALFFNFLVKSKLKNN